MKPSTDTAPASSEPGSGLNGVFVTTHWSVVLTAARTGAGQAREALAKLCRTYWPPLYEFARRQGQTPHDAQDLTQEFFARLLKKDYLHSVAKEKGRFRTFLLIAFKRFLANEWDKARAQKRGGGVSFVPIDQELAESRFAAGPSHALQPDLLFDREWAVALLDRTMSRLQEEYVASGRAKLFEMLRGALGRDQSALSYAELAARLNLTEAAVKMSVQRLRARYREILRAEISETVSSPEEVDDEIRYLFTTFGP